MNLTKSQSAALDHFTNQGKSRHDAAWRSLSEILHQADIEPDSFSEAVAKIKTHARVGLHFHPDRPDPDMKPVAKALLETRSVPKSVRDTDVRWR